MNTTKEYTLTSIFHLKFLIYDIHISNICNKVSAKYQVKEEKLIFLIPHCFFIQG